MTNLSKKIISYASLVAAIANNNVFSATEFDTKALEANGFKKSPPSALQVLASTSGEELPGPKECKSAADQQTRVIDPLASVMQKRLDDYIETEKSQIAKPVPGTIAHTTPAKEPVHHGDMATLSLESAGIDFAEASLFREEPDLRTLEELTTPVSLNAIVRTPPAPLQLGLSLGGGGTRGYISSIWLDHLESALKRPIYKVFDCIGGTSIGGIQALGLAAPDASKKQPRLNTSDFVELFKSKSTRIFPKGNLLERVIPDALKKLANYKFTVYNPKPLEDLLQEQFALLPLSSALTDVVVIATDNQTLAPRVFSSRQAGASLRDDFLMWQVGRATSAGQTYFPAYSLTSVNGDKVGPLSDGGLAANNPALSVYDELRLLNNDTGSVRNGNYGMLYLGTGFWDATSLPTDGGQIDYASHVIDALFMSQLGCIEQGMYDLLGKDGYFPVNTKLSHQILLDSTESNDLATYAEAAAAGIPALDKFLNSDLLRKKLELA